MSTRDWNSLPSVDYDMPVKKFSLRDFFAIEGFDIEKCGIGRFYEGDTKIPVCPLAIAAGIRMQTDKTFLTVSNMEKFVEKWDAANESNPDSLSKAQILASILNELEPLPLTEA